MTLISNTVVYVLLIFVLVRHIFYALYVKYVQWITSFYISKCCSWSIVRCTE